MSLLRKVYADVPTTVSNPLGNRFTSIADVFALLINVIIGVGIALTIVYLVLGGIQYITSRGDTKAADEARGALTNAVIGFVVVLGAITVRIVVGNILGANDTSTYNELTPF